MTALEKSRMLRDRYAVIVGPLLLLIGVSLGSTTSAAPVLGWTAAVVLIAVTANWLLWATDTRSQAEDSPVER